MNYIEIKTVFKAGDPRIAEELIADAYADAGIDGVAIMDPCEEPAEEWAKDYLAPDIHEISGYLPEEEDADATIEFIRKRLERIARNTGLSYEIAASRVVESDWTEKWKSYFSPIVISPRIAIKPTWKSYSPGRGQVVIELDPGMAFGTGSHPTTIMCLELIETHLKPGDTVLDVGTGSGILMIAAAKLGASAVEGVDINETAVEVAEENLLRNGVNRFKLYCGDLLKPGKRRFDMVVANITPPVISRLLPDLKSLMKPGGVFVCSGFLKHDTAPMVRKLEKAGLKKIATRSLEGWSAVAAKPDNPLKPGSP